VRDRTFDLCRPPASWCPGLLFFLALTGCVAAQTDASLRAEIDRTFADVADESSPGYAVGVTRGGAVWYAAGFGIANLDHVIPISPSSVFNVASLSKQFTAAALGLLVLRGEIRLEDEVRLHNPEFPERFGSVRVEHLVYMTSGLPEYYTLERAGGRDWYLDTFTIDDAMAAVFEQPRLEFDPGSAWAYSNTNYQMLAEIVARVSGVTFAEFSKREIFDPLGFTETHVNDDVGAVVPDRATGYNRSEGGGHRQELRRSPHYGGSGLFTSVRDLAKWDRSLRDHLLGGPALTELLLSTRRFEHDKVDDAFGLVWGEFEGRRTLSYEGGDAGFSSYMVRVPDEDLAVIVLSNLGTGAARDRASAILRLLLRS
jgi:CubicO group peptidase (beta-lactamase class C family)